MKRNLKVFLWQNRLRKCPKRKERRKKAVRCAVRCLRLFFFFISSLHLNGFYIYFLLRKATHRIGHQFRQFFFPSSSSSFVVFFQFLFVSSNKNWNCYVYASYVYCNKLGKNAIPRSRKIEPKTTKKKPNCFRLIRAKVKDGYIATTATVTTTLKEKKRQTDTQSKVFSLVYITLLSLSRLHGALFSFGCLSVKKTHYFFFKNR